MLIGLGAVNEANYLENEIKKLKKKKFAQKYLAITIACVVLGIVFILYLKIIILWEFLSKTYNQNDNNINFEINLLNLTMRNIPFE